MAILVSFLIASGCQGFNPADLTPQPLPSATADANASPTATPPPPLPAFTPTVTSIPVPTSAITVETGSLRGVQLNFWMPQFEGWMPGAVGSLLEVMVGEFNQQNEWGIRVQTRSFENYEDLYGSIQSVFQPEFPDLMLGYTFQSADLDRAVRRLADLDFFIDDPVWGISDAEHDFYPSFWESEVVEGKRLGIPFYRLGQVLYYNATWGQELGFDGPPVNPEQFQSQVCAASAQVEEMPEGRGGWSVGIDAPSVLSWIYAFGGEVLQPGPRVYSFDSPQGVDAFNFINGLHTGGCAWLERDRPSADVFAARNALVVSGSLAGIPALNSAMTKAGNDDRWTILPFPSLIETPGLIAYGPSLSILETTEEKQFAAWLFIRWLVEAENQARVVQETGAFPTRLSAQEHLVGFADGNPRWAEAQKLVEITRSEPSLPSWGIVRWVVSDAAGFLFSPFFEPGEVDKLLEELDRTAVELHTQRR